MTTRRMSSSRIGRRLAEQAREAVPNDTDLWPSIVQRLPRAQQPACPVRGWFGQGLQMAGALAAVIVPRRALGRVFEPRREKSKAAIPTAGLTTPSPLATPAVIPDGPGDLAIHVGD